MIKLTVNIICYLNYLFFRIGPIVEVSATNMRLFIRLGVRFPPLPTAFYHLLNQLAMDQDFR